MKTMNKHKAAAIANLTLGSTMSVDDVIKAYFQNDSETIMKGVAMSCSDPEKIFDILEQANYEIENEEVLATKSNFGKIQKDIVAELLNDKNISFIETNIINNPKVVGENKECPEIELAYSMVEDMKNKNMGISMTK